MTQLEKLILMAEDELTQYSTDARKIEKLRQKINLSLSIQEQKKIKEELLAQIPSDPISKLIETQRQTVALPFWGIAGLGLLFGISLHQPKDFIATIIAIPLAIIIQKKGWKIQAQRLVISALEEIENRIKNLNNEKSPS